MTIRSDAQAACVRFFSAQVNSPAARNAAREGMRLLRTLTNAPDPRGDEVPAFAFQPMAIAQRLSTHPDLEEVDLPELIAKAVRVGRGDFTPCEECDGDGTLLVFPASDGGEDLDGELVEDPACNGLGIRFPD